MNSGVQDAALHRRGGGSPRLRRIMALSLVPFVALIAAAPNALAAQKVISSAGPLPNIYLNDNLACQAGHTGDAAPEFYSGTDPGACGTFLSTGSVSYGPNVPAGSTRTEFGPASQTGVTGTGALGSPYTVVTVVHVGGTGLDITQTDSYVVGREAYRTDIAVRNTATSGSPVTATLYHAADCFLQDSDVGNGFHDSTSGGIYCSKNIDNSPAGRVEGFVPLSAGSHYYEAGFSTVWAAITAAGANFPDSCGCSTLQDNGAGINWALSIPANTTVTRSLVTAFSPTGVIPDTTPPRTVIDSGPSGSTGDATPTFGFHSSEAGSSFECSIDTGTPSFGPCSGPGRNHTPAALTAGTYTFRVRATDAAANTDLSPAARSFTVLGAGALPVFKRKANASRVSGVVKVRVPGSRRFVVLQGGRLIPIGSIIDARNGRVHIVSADGNTGKTREADFFEGLFKLRQGKKTGGYTDAKLVGPLACGSARAGATVSKRRRGRHVWGSGKGRHSSTGKNSSGSVRGTEWLVWDRCDGSTWTFAKSGKVLVRDFRTGRKVLLRKGQHYVARP
jgi:hypothetical protein